MLSVTAETLKIYSLNEKALTIEFGSVINEKTLQKIRQFDQALAQKSFPGFRTTVPAYTTLTVFFDPVQVIKAEQLEGQTCFERVSNYLNRLNEFNYDASEEWLGEVISIPVCYGGEFGPDLAEVASINNKSAEEVIRIHSAATYTVYMIGFVPGFAYMGGMDESIAAPRKAAPRAAIPAGSVGIAGQQTGIYPLETPGGWQIIGRTPLTLFDASRSQPSLLSAGDKIQFHPISETEFNSYAR